MLLTITFKIQSTGQDMDIQMNSQEAIADTLAVLASRELMDRTILEQLTEVYSVRKKEQIDIRKTYEENKIHTGDILCI